MESVVGSAVTAMTLIIIAALGRLIIFFSINMVMIGMTSELPSVGRMSKQISLEELLKNTIIIYIEGKGVRYHP